MGGVLAHFGIEGCVVCQRIVVWYVRFVFFVWVGSGWCCIGGSSGWWGGLLALASLGNGSHRVVWADRSLLKCQF